jgi:hypothetical protein
MAADKLLKGMIRDHAPDSSFRFPSGRLLIQEPENPVCGNDPWLPDLGINYHLGLTGFSASHHAGNFPRPDCYPFHLAAIRKGEEFVISMLFMQTAMIAPLSLSICFFSVSGSSCWCPCI